MSTRKCHEKSRKKGSGEEYTLCSLELEERK